MKQPAIYIVTNKPGGVLYIGVTSDLVKRVWQHRSDAVEGFSRRYRLHELVYFEQFESMIEAIEREKELKKWRRAWKVSLIEANNPRWRDLWNDLIGREQIPGSTAMKPRRPRNDGTNSRHSGDSGGGTRNLLRIPRKC